MSSLVNKIVGLFYEKPSTHYIEHTMETHLSVSVSETIKTQMQKGRDKGYHSWWHNQRCTKEDLHLSLQNAVDRGDYSTAMIFSAMLEFRAKHELEQVVVNPFEILSQTKFVLNRLRVNMYSDNLEYLQHVYEAYILNQDSMISDDFVMDNGETTFADMLVTKLIENKLLAKPYHIIFVGVPHTANDLTLTGNWDVIPQGEVYPVEEDRMIIDHSGIEYHIDDSISTFIFQKSTEGANVVLGGHNLPYFIDVLCDDGRKNDLYLVYTGDTNDREGVFNKNKYVFMGKHKLTETKNKYSFRGEPCQTVFL